MADTPPTRPSFPWQIRIAGAITTAIVAASRRLGGPNRRRLLSLLDFRAPPNPSPVDGVATSDHVVDPARNLSLRLFLPIAVVSSDQKIPVVVYFHGGGFVFNSAFSRPYDSFCRTLSRQIPAVVVSVDYRLAPEHRLPAAYDDCSDALRWLDGRPDLVPDLSAVFIAGESAGGNIAHHVAARVTTSSYERLTVAGVVAIQPFFGGEEETESERRLEGVPFGSREDYKWMWRCFLPEGSSLDHEAANVFVSSDSDTDTDTAVLKGEDWSRFPPTMVAVGGWDTLQDRQRWYCEGLKKAGVEVRLEEYPDGVHAFQFFTGLPETEKLIADVGDFVRKWSNNAKLTDFKNQKKLITR